MLFSLAIEYSLCWCVSWIIVDLMEVEKVETTEWYCSNGPCLGFCSLPFCLSVCVVSHQVVTDLLHSRCWSGQPVSLSPFLSGCVCVSACVKWNELYVCPTLLESLLSLSSWPGLGKELRHSHWLSLLSITEGSLRGAWSTWFLSGAESSSAAVLAVMPVSEFH